MKENGYEHGNEPCCPDVCGFESCNETFLEEKIDVCVPVTVEPSVVVGCPIVSVVGSPCVEEIKCPPSSQKGICKFTITQTICVKVPITINAMAKSNNGLSTDCCDEHRNIKYTKNDCCGKL